MMPEMVHVYVLCLMFMDYETMEQRYWQGGKHLNDY